MSNIQTTRNALASVVQIVMCGGILFVLYKFVVGAIGTEQFGVWALVMAATSFAQFANLGFSGSVVKYVAKYMAYGDNEKASQVIQTAIISIAAISGAIVLAVYPAIRWGLGLVIASKSLATAVSLLPLSLVSFWFLMIAGVFYAALDGYKRTDIRCALLVGVSCVNLLLSYLLIPIYGLFGLAYAVVVSNFIAIVSGWILVRAINKQLPLILFTWRKSVFKEIGNYAVNFQLISITGMLADPLIKAFLSKYGGLSIVGLYEMVVRMILQVRALLVSSYQVLVPVLAELKERNPEKIPLVYVKSYNLLYYISVPVFSLLIIWMPLVSKIWIGHEEVMFVFLGRVFSIVWLINALAVPAYTANLGAGDLRWNLVGHVATALLNVVLGYLCGLYWGGKGVALGAAIAFTIGSLLIIIPYHLTHNMSFLRLFPGDSGPIAILSLVGVFVSLISSYINSDFGIVLVSSLSIVSLVLLILILAHPLRHRLQDRVLDALHLSPKKMNITIGV